MATEELVKYVQAARAQGMSDEQISHNLLEQGWQKEEVDAAMHGAVANNPSQPAAKPNTTKSEGSTVWGVLAIILAIVFAPAGIVLSIVAIKKGSKIMGIIALVISIPMMLVIFIGYMAYFLVLSPSTLLPEKCTFPIQIACNNHVVHDDSITLMLQNGAGRDMLVQSIEASGPNIDGSCEAVVNAPWTNGEHIEYTIYGCTFVNPDNYEKGRFDIVINYAWTDSPDMPHQFRGELFAALP